MTPSLEFSNDIMFYQPEDARFVLRAYFFMACPSNAFSEVLEYLDISESGFFDIRNRGSAEISKAVDKIFAKYPTPEYRQMIVSSILADVLHNYNYWSDFLMEFIKANKADGYEN